MSEPRPGYEPSEHPVDVVRSGRYGQIIVTREAVEGVARQLKARPIPMTIEHDPTRPPIGRAHFHSLVEAEDGEVVIRCTMEPPRTVRALFVSMRRIQEVLDGLPALEPSPGALELSSGIGSYAVEDLEAVAGALGSDDVRIGADGVGRFSAVPEALLIIALGLPTSAIFWFLKGFFTTLGENLGQQVGEDGYEAFKTKLRDLVAARRNPMGQPPLTQLTLELPRSEGTTLVEGSTRGTGSDLDAFLDSGSDLLAVARMYQELLPDSERLAKLHFAFVAGCWEFRYGLDDDAQQVQVVIVADETYKALLAKGRRPLGR